MARKVEDKYQIVYGHHRLVALRELGIKEVDIPVKDISDGMMIKIMASENRETYRSNRAVVVETVKVARDWLREQMQGGWEGLDKSIQSLFEDKQGFLVSQGKGVGKQTITAFLGTGWKEWEIQEALSQLTETPAFDPKAMESFDTLGVAAAAKDAMVRFKVPKKRQKALAKTLVAKGVSKHNMTQEVADAAKKEGRMGGKEEGNKTSSDAAGTKALNVAGATGYTIVRGRNEGIS